MRPASPVLAGVGPAPIPLAGARGSGLRSLVEADIDDEVAVVGADLDADLVIDLVEVRREIRGG